MKRALAKRLAAVAGFEHPQAELEQYPTSPALAANIIHLADLQADLNRPVIDLGTGTGMLALAAATRGPPRVAGIELDGNALMVALSNEQTVAPATGVDWIQGDATDPPVSTGAATVVMNPPFGAQHGQRGADRAFLDATRRLATSSYSVHNQGSRSFIESYTEDHGAEVTHAFAAELPIDAQFDFHTSDRAGIPVEVFRIEWS